MGGSAFDQQASRLTQEQHARLTRIITDLAAPFFQGTSAPRNTASKKTHGDVDVICGYAGEKCGGQEEWDPESKTLVPLKGGKLVAGQPADELRALAVTLMGAIGAVGLRRHGSSLNYKVPLSILDATETSSEKFYQVDLALVAPGDIEFNTFLTSYGATSFLLGRCLRFYSHSVVIHLTHFVFRHAPFFGIPPIDITLTNDPAEFCKWFGLDYQVWKTEGLQWRWDWQFWKWLTDVEDGTPAAVAYKQMIRRVKRDGAPVSFGKRDRFPSEFYRYLLERSKWSKEWENTTSAEEGSESDSSRGKRKQVPDEMQSIIDIDNPAESDEGGAAVLTYWGKEKVYQELFEQRKALAAPIAESQKFKLEKKARQKALLDAQEAMIKINFGGSAVDQ
ncbi:hypothetical protein L202_03464 [Cryptococcus amylolentus CBS 6039]|uniref:Uncharacterized protein n=2 Tax=Cryptococcus amylolentus TaxID=104669 RepID=A0A1E3HT29_9TREE|nr:hypothetical protein L202_03464 [Cryptococcus amylolentus CBS 6039]ODN79494.1 hypothetical protein L202_03464 [Cryptococcus amylolentus CBS 6039]ODO07845.1 hypothetical protein I350_03424 [Cryptococcus amylolentus CBS 6273]